MDVGIHSIDLIRWLAGEFEEVDYRGNTSPGTVEREAEMTFRLANGANSRLVASRIRDLAQKMTFAGSRGFIEVGLWDQTLRIRSEKGKLFQNLPYLDLAVPRRPPSDASFVIQLSHLVSAVRGEEELLVTGEEGMAAVDVVCRAYAGATSGPCTSTRR